MPAPQNVFALVFDFDDTLTPDSTTQLLRSRRIDADAFWQKDVGGLVDRGYDPAIAFLTAFLGLTRTGQPFAGLTAAELTAFGGRIKLYPGLPKLFTDLRAICAQFTQAKPTVEFYVISGGLEEVITGSEAAGHLNGVRGCRLAADAPNGPLTHIQNVVNFTEKTKYLFEINKGVLANDRKNPFAVNEYVPTENCRIPFEHMIDIGDGLTDVPSFSLLKGRGGKAFGLFDPTNEGAAKRAWEKFTKTSRVTNVNSPKYGPKHDLGALLRAAVREMCMRLETGMRMA